MVRGRKGKGSGAVDARALLAAHELRVTHSRLAVLSELVDAARPMTHADLFARLDPLGFDRVTLYRNLDTFTEAGILRRTEVGDRTWRYELASHGHGGGTHAHFVCVDCGIMRCLPDDAVMLKSPSLRAQTVEVQVKGHCATCSPAAQR